MEKNSKILVLGHNGLVGSALLKELKAQGFYNIITVARNVADLTNYKEVFSAFCYHMPDYVVNCAGKVGGIYANDNQGADFIRENLQISINVIEACRQIHVKKLVYLGSSSIYSKDIIQPINESEFMHGTLDESTIGYATAKIAGIKMCQLYNKQYYSNFISLIPPNVYGENDNFDLVNSHVIPGMMVKFENAKMNKDSSVVLWGDGTPKREFLYAGDLAKAIIFLMNEYNSPEIINVGTGIEIELKELANIIKSVVGYTGKIEWNEHFKNGMDRKLLNVKKINDLGWKSETNLTEGIKTTYEWFINNYYTCRKK
jgi:GDP-L-fucose synthase